MTEIIAELASSHGGQRKWQDWAIEAAADAGADYLKFQSYQTRHLSPADPQYQWLKDAELSDADHERLMKLCQKHGIKFLTTVFTYDRVAFLAGLGLQAIKIGSGEASDERLLSNVARHPWKVYVSTGLLTLRELDRVNAILGANMVTMMHTVSAYPTPTDKVNLGRMEWLRAHCNRPTGYSDHTQGNAAAMAAIALGADTVEVHLSDPTAPRYREWDKSASELAYLCRYRELVEQMKAQGRMVWSPTEERPFVGRWQHGI